jgi:hypothetical protein
MIRKKKNNRKYNGGKEVEERGRVRSMTRMRRIKIKSVVKITTEEEDEK